MLLSFKALSEWPTISKSVKHHTGEMLYITGCGFGISIGMSLQIPLNKIYFYGQNVAKCVKK